MDWGAFMTTMTSIGIGATALAYLARRLLDSVLSRDLEKFKIQLKADSEKELEQLRNQLRMAAFEREVQFSKLHEKRAEAIAEVYRKLDLADRSFRSMTNPVKIRSEDEEERAREDNKLAGEAGVNARAFLDCYNASKIYFDEDLCGRLDMFAGELWKAWVNYHIHPSLAGIQGQTVGKSRFEAWKTVSDKVPEMRREIERAFRKMLGHSTKAETTL